MAGVILWHFELDEIAARVWRFECRTKIPVIPGDAIAETITEENGRRK